MPDLSIVGGRYRGVKLESPRDVRTHPMGAREKNALFNRLTGVIEGATVLDAYAGTGALAAEALSRGAAKVVLVEKAAKIARVATRNLQRVAPAGDTWQVIASSVGNFADEASEKFDIIIADPPYDQLELAEIAKLARILREGGVLALSHPSRMPAPELEGLAITSSKNYAGASITLYQKVGNA